MSGIEVDVCPRENAELARSQVEVERQRVDLAPLDRDHLAREELERLLRVEERLATHLPRLTIPRWLDADARVRLAVEDAEVAPLARRRGLERAREAAPHVHRRLARDRAAVPSAALPGPHPLLDGAVERIADVLDVAPGHERDRLRTEGRGDPLPPARPLRLGVGASELDGVRVVALEPGVARLAGGAGDRGLAFRDRRHLGVVDRVVRVLVLLAEVDVVARGSAAVALRFRDLDPCLAAIGERDLASPVPAAARISERDLVALEDAAALPRALHRYVAPFVVAFPMRLAHWRQKSRNPSATTSLSCPGSA